MPKIEKYAPGDFCWFELGTTDQEAAKPFYSAVLGWSASDAPMGPDGVYTRFLLGGESIGGGYTMRPDEVAMTPPHWNLYVAVENADETTNLIAALGGKVIEGPFDVATFGRMAVIQDPAGVYFNIWQPKDHPGAGVAGEIGTFCWADLCTPDPDLSKHFFEGLFGWKIGPAENFPPQYPVIRNGEKVIGGIRPETSLPPHWMLFFLTGDVDATVATAQEMGGAVHSAPMNMGTVRFATLADAQGAAFSVINRG
jgi:predicted enzyme related to lactoylglutathione lyase